MKHLIVLIGPTAVGKTEVSLAIAKHYNLSVINADSRQIFIEMPIGTAAPTIEEQKEVKHYFIGTHHVNEYYSAYEFETDVMKLLRDHLFQDQDIALLSGGSMMYIDAVCKGLDDIPTVNKQTRSTIYQKYQNEGLPKLLDELRILDPDHYNVVDKNNYRRVCHALEICHMTGKTYTSFLCKSPKIRPFNIIKVGLCRPREENYDRINKRVRDMIEHGFIKEAEHLYEMRHYNALNTVGYKELFEYMDSKLSLEEAITKIQSNTRRYMRKQITWFKKDPDVMWFNPSQVEQIVEYIDTKIQR